MKLERVKLTTDPTLANPGRLLYFDEQHDGSAAGALNASSNKLRDHTPFFSDVRVVDACAL